MLDLDVILDRQSAALAQTTALSDMSFTFSYLITMLPDRTLVGLISQVFMHLAIIVARQKVSRQESPKGFVPLSEVRANPLLKRGKLICRTIGAVGLLAYIALALSGETRPIDLIDCSIVVLFLILVLGASGHLDQSVHRQIEDRATADFLRLIAMDMEEMVGEKRVRTRRWDSVRTCLGL